MNSLKQYAHYAFKALKALGRVTVAFLQASGIEPDTTDPNYHYEE